MNITSISLNEVEPTLAAFGRRHEVIDKLEVFGSVATGRASADSDIDVMVTFRNETPRDLRYVSLFTSLIEELHGIFGCKVDLVDRQALRDDAFSFNAVLNSRIVYERL